MVSVSRRELKFLLNYEESLALQEDLDKLLTLDSYSQEGFYYVRSLYFDSLNDKDFVQKYDGAEQRRKIRLRIYDSHQDSAKFEIKEKQGAYQKKDSLSIDRMCAESFINGDFSRLLDHDEPEAHRLFALLTMGAYHPAAVVEYERRAYTYAEYETRITFDRNVQSSEFYYELFSDDIPFVPVLNEQVILEVKYNDVLLESIRSVLGKYGLTNVSVSKYGIGRPVMAHYIL